MTVRKDEPMNNVAARDDEFDALLDASSLGAAHVVAVSDDIPTASRERMAQALRQQQEALTDAASQADAPQHPQTDNVASSWPKPRSSTPLTVDTEHRLIDGSPLGPISVGKSNLFAVIEEAINIAFQFAQPNRPTTPLPSSDGLIREWAERWAHKERHQLRRTWLSAHLVPRSGRTADSVSRPITSCALTHQMQHNLASTTAQRSGPMLLTAPDPEAVFNLLTSIRVTPGTLRGGAQDLRQFVQPTVEPIASPAAEPMKLSVRTAVPARLHITRFADCGYTRADNGLMLPVARETEHQHQQTTALRKYGRANQVTWQGCRVPAAQARLWITTTDSGRVQHADMPMEIHQEEHEAGTEEIRTRFIYRTSDPYAVEARFRVEARDETVWVFARDLLRDGLERSAGQGDVTVWPQTVPSGQKRLFIRLTSPEGTALLSAADTDMRLFLKAAGDLVQYGAEPTHLAPALDALESAIGELTRPGTRE